MSERGRKKARIEQGATHPDHHPLPSPQIKFNDLPGEIKKQGFGFLDVKTLCIAREVSREWRKSCEQAIEDKKEDGAGEFTTNFQLRAAVNDIYKCKYEEYDSELAEKVAREYGWVIGRWNVSAVTDFSKVFFKKFWFDDPIGDWAVGNGTTFKDMFFKCHVFDQDLSNWSMGNAVNLKGMFAWCKKFNQDLNWDISNVRNISYMFNGASSFNGDIITSWDTSNVTKAHYCFYEARAFNKDVSRWNMSCCTDMSSMFEEAVSFNQNLAWDTSSATEMTGMFYNASSFSGNLCAWDVSSVVTFGGMFYGSGVTQEDLSSWEGWHANERNDFRKAFQQRNEDSDTDDSSAVVVLGDDDNCTCM